MKKIAIILFLIFSSVICGQENSKKIIDSVKIETIGGKLDFELKLKDDKRGLYLIDGIAYNKKNYGIFLWGVAVNKIGITSHKKAYKLWEEINKRKLTKSEKKALIKGYKTKS